MLPKDGLTSPDNDSSMLKESKLDPQEKLPDCIIHIPGNWPEFGELLTMNLL